MRRYLILLLLLLPLATDAQRYDEHVVKMGETAYSVARGYAISPLRLAEDNQGVDLTKLRIGQVLRIRRRDRGKTDAEQVEREWSAISSVWGETKTDSVAAPTQPAAEIVVKPTLKAMAVEDFSMGGTPDIALMLPLSGVVIGSDFAEFYRGALLALEDLKKKGRMARVTVWDSERSAEKVQNIIESPEFAATDLVIGPVWPNELEPVVRWGELHGVPVVSPLAPSRDVTSEALWQMAPQPESKYLKMSELFNGANVIVVSSGDSADDADFAHEVGMLLEGRPHRRISVSSGAFGSMIDWNRPNVVVVLAGSELAVNVALTTISSAYNKLSATTSRRAEIYAIGNSRWANYEGTSIDENLLFKLNTRYVTNYHIDRSNPQTLLFEARYLEAYGGFPSRAAFRGYDAMALFGGALFERGSSFGQRLEKVGVPLATPYRFVDRMNMEWTVVSYSNDYNIVSQ